MGSKNAFHKEGRSSEEAEASIAKFCGIDSGQLPTTRTIDDVLKKLDHEELNEVQMRVFEVLRKDKFFSTIRCSFQETDITLLSMQKQRISIPSAHECENCPFCLKRERGEEIWYLHMHAVSKTKVLCFARFSLCKWSCYQAFK
jgi:hypothetical protein